MCSKCFENEIKQFNSTSEFKRFEIELEEKLRQNDGPFFLRQSSETELVNYAIYACRSCNSKWYLQIPNAVSLGFFLFEVNAKFHLDKIKASDTKKRMTTIAICLIIMFVCLVLLAGMV